MGIAWPIGTILLQHQTKWKLHGLIQYPFANECLLGLQNRTEIILTLANSVATIWERKKWLIHFIWVLLQDEIYLFNMFKFSGLHVRSQEAGGMKHQHPNLENLAKEALFRQWISKRESANSQVLWQYQISKSLMKLTKKYFDPCLLQMKNVWLRILSVFTKFLKLVKFRIQSLC